MRDFGGSIRIVICDGHALIRSALRDLLESEPDLVVVGEAANADEAVLEVRKSHPDVLLLDVSMRGPSGLETLPRLSEASPRTSIVVVSIEPAPSLRRAAFALGARGWVAKNAPGEIVSTVRQAAKPAEENAPAPDGPTATERRTGRDRRAGIDRRQLRVLRPAGMERRVGDRRSAVDRRKDVSSVDVR